MANWPVLATCSTNLPPLSPSPTTGAPGAKQSRRVLRPRELHGAEGSALDASDWVREHQRLTPSYWHAAEIPKSTIYKGASAYPPKSEIEFVKSMNFGPNFFGFY
jgi:hypothetical protein